MGAEDKFKAAADELQTKQNTIANFLNRKAEVESAVVPHDAAATPVLNMSAASMDDGPAGDSLQLPGGANLSADTDNGSSLSVMPGPAAPQQRTAKPAHASLIDDTFAKLRQMA